MRPAVGGHSVQESWVLTLTKRKMVVGPKCKDSSGFKVSNWAQITLLRIESSISGQ